MSPFSWHSNWGTERWCDFPSHNNSQWPGIKLIADHNFTHIKLPHELDLFIQFQLTKTDFVPLWNKFFAGHKGQRKTALRPCPPSACSLVQVVYSWATGCQWILVKSFAKCCEYRSFLFFFLERESVCDSHQVLQWFCEPKLWRKILAEELVSNVMPDNTAWA